MTDRLFEGDPAPTDCFQELVSIKSENAIGEAGAARMVPWLRKNPDRRADYLVIITDPRKNSPELRQTIKRLEVDMADSILDRMIVVNADTPAENRRCVVRFDASLCVRLSLSVCVSVCVCVFVFVQLCLSMQPFAMCWPIAICGLLFINNLFSLSTILVLVLRFPNRDVDRWMKKNNAFKIDVYSDEKMEWLQQYTALGKDRWSMSLFVVADERVVKIAREVDGFQAVRVVTNALKGLV